MRRSGRARNSDPNDHQQSGPHRTSVRVAGALLFAGFLLGSIELGSFLAISFVITPRDKSAFYRIPSVTRDEYDRYMQIRAPDLGWPAPSAFGGSALDASGARRSPAFPQPGNECVLLFGDSFTYADEVEADVAWGNLLAKRIGCRVGNFGVGGYGTDQSLMRFQAQSAVEARVAILGIFPHNLLRNVNQERYFLTAGNALGLKPRFVLDGGVLRPVDLPAPDYNSYLESLEEPAAHYPYERFTPDSEFGPITLAFPYTGVMLRYLLSERVQNYLRGRPGWLGFFAPDHPSGALPVTAEICNAFAELARDRGMHPMVLVFVTPASLAYFGTAGALATQPLLDALDAQGIDHLDLHRPLLSHLGARSYCDILTQPTQCRGHFSPEGNRLVAEIIHDHLSRLGIAMQ